MGWKRFKEHFNIEHIVHSYNNVLYVGSTYCPNLGQIDMATGKIIKRNDIFDDFFEKYYPEVLNVSEEFRLELIQSEDFFKKSLPIFLVENDSVVEKKTEEFNFPNVTHDGTLLYDNTSFKTEIEALKYSLKNMNSSIKFFKERISSLNNEIKNIKLENNNTKLKKEETKNRLKILKDKKRHE